MKKALLVVLTVVAILAAAIGGFYFGLACVDHGIITEKTTIIPETEEVVETQEDTEIAQETEVESWFEEHAKSVTTWDDVDATSAWVSQEYLEEYAANSETYGWE